MIRSGILDRIAAVRIPASTAFVVAPVGIFSNLEEKHCLTLLPSSRANNTPQIAHAKVQQHETELLVNSRSIS